MPKELRSHKARRFLSFFVSISITILSFHYILYMQQDDINIHNSGSVVYQGIDTTTNISVSSLEWQDNGDGDLTTFNPHSNILIRMRCPRRDRLGSNVQRPFNLLAYAACKKYSFCIIQGQAGLARYFSFPTCDPIHETSNHHWLFHDEMIENSSGIYDFGMNCGAQNKLEGTLLGGVWGLSGDCLYPRSLRDRWSRMIHKAAFHPEINNTLANQNLFWQGERVVHDSTIYIALHIRRGDLVWWGQRGIWDEIYVQLLQKLRGALEQLGKIPVVHVFSEDYGMIDGRHNISADWTLYDGLVDHFHLAPLQKGPGDPALNIRDWKHFVMADILVVGGTFSTLPAYGRPSWRANEKNEEGYDGITGLTIWTPNGYGLPFYKGSWKDYGNGIWKMDQLTFHNMPSILNITN